MVIDFDFGENVCVIYSIIFNFLLDLDWFEISVIIGFIIIKSIVNIDCEYNFNLWIIVIVIDYGSLFLLFIVIVSIIIDDVNDFEFVFERLYYEVKVFENVVVGFCILAVSLILKL